MSKRNQTSRSEKSLQTLSRSLSWALRHKAPMLGLEMSCDGYVPVDDLLNCGNPRFRGWTEEDVRAVVDTNDKKRYKLCRRTIKGNEDVLCIRANQGHSIPNIDPHLLLTPVAPEELRSLTIIHGTFLDAWEEVKTKGLSRMTRNHIHFASGLPKDKEVISGMRKSCQVYIYVDGERCAADGVEFFRSDNGVLLTAGVDNKGILPTNYFSSVTDVNGNELWTKNE